MVTISSSAKVSGLQDPAEESNRIMRFVTGDTANETIDRYNEWAPTYDEDLDGCYMGYIYAADVVAEVVPEDRRAEARVLDVAAGTGKIGIELARRGFKHLEALEPAAMMLEILKKTNVYGRTYQEYIGLGKTTVPSDYCDVVVMSGALSKGHVPKESIEECVRITKTGGFITIMMRKEYTDKGGDLEDFEDYLSSLEKRNLLKKVSRKVFPNYFFNHDGLSYIYRVM